MIKKFLFKRIPTPIAIGIIIALVALVGGYTWWQFDEIRKDEADIPNIILPEKRVEADSCFIDEDCIVFGEDGDCNCGCFNMRHNWKAEGECFCAAPNSCKCVEGKCEGVFGEETAGWKVYRNEEYGFEIKYPKAWDFIQEPLSFIFISRTMKDEASEFKCSLIVSIWDKEAVKGSKNLLISTGKWEESETKLNDYPATKLVDKESLINTYYFLKDKDSFMIGYSIDKYIINEDNQRVVFGSVYNQECIDLFNQMLSTFRFLD